MKESTDGTSRGDTERIVSDLRAKKKNMPNYALRLELHVVDSARFYFIAQEKTQKNVVVQLLFFQLFLFRLTVGLVIINLIQTVK